MLNSGFSELQDANMVELTNRQSDILNIARSSGRVTVEDLTRRFGVSAQTIRKDLKSLNTK